MDYEELLPKHLYARCKSIVRSKSVQRTSTQKRGWEVLYKDDRGSSACMLLGGMLSAGVPSAERRPMLSRPDTMRGGLLVPERLVPKKAAFKRVELSICTKQDM